LPTAIAVAALAPLAACDFHPEKVTGTRHIVSQEVGPIDPDAAENRLYADAIGAVDQRDYATALDELQLARTARPNDPRVYAAMGVVYDKLGRFDLSARYYEKAETLDPGSRVVAIDRAYSARLQHLQSASAREVAVVAPAETERPTVTVSRIEPAKLGAVELTRPHLTDQLLKAGILIVNATGRPEGADAVKTYLARQGWTVFHPRGRVDTTNRAGATHADPHGVSEFKAAYVTHANAPPPAAVTDSRVLYPAFAPRIAKSLARSLPFRVKLVQCGDCNRLQLVLGRDATPRQPPALTLGQRPR
jgi:hypothetical protein